MNKINRAINRKAKQRVKRFERIWNWVKCNPQMIKPFTFGADLSNAKDITLVVDEYHDYKFYESEADNG